MLFNSIQFLLFFPAVVLVYFALPRRVRWGWLLVCSYYFYMCWNPAYALLMLASTVLTYAGARLVHRAHTQRAKRAWLAACLAANLAILFYFKYANFALRAAAQALGLFHVTFAAPHIDVLLPVGISFYTFQALGYTIDVYRGTVKPEPNLARYALFVSFFPQLVAGPIERSANLLHQLREVQNFDFARVKRGVLRMLWGYFEKVVIADRAAQFVSEAFDGCRAYDGTVLTVAVVLFAVQVYCDFAGYSDIAIGAAEVLGVRLMENFRQPYFARSLSEFWNRWHISLSTWLGDYVFEPLVWSNWTHRLPLVGKKLQKPPVYSALLLTFFISGLWHGASWTFVLWGLYHGVMQVLGKMAKPLRRRVQRALHCNVRSAGYQLWQQMVVFSLVCGGYVLFRANTLADAGYIFGAIATKAAPWSLFDGTLTNIGMSMAQWRVLLASIAVLWGVDVLRARGVALRTSLERCRRPVRWVAYCAFVTAITVFGVYGPQFDAARFLYFQF